MAQAASSDQSTAIPNPFCEVGRNHPRDRHRMRPVECYDHVWYCSRHDLYAVLEDTETANALDRGDPHPLPDGSPGVVVRQGDERAGGMIVYVRAES
jgi:hypothetical protein